jgi:hypothetical protein
MKDPYGADTFTVAIAPTSRKAPEPVGISIPDGLFAPSAQLRLAVYEQEPPSAVESGSQWNPVTQSIALKCLLEFPGGEKVPISTDENTSEKITSVVA